eukprot:SAG31_NODE_8184_length_1501_cov_1.594151_2_plen_140_part_00
MPWLCFKIREEKFISANDVVTTIITSNRAVSLEITGRSFAAADNAAGKVLSLHGQCTIDSASNSIQVQESGTVSAHVRNDPDRFVTGKLMYNGMTGILAASQPLQVFNNRPQSAALCNRISLPCLSDCRACLYLRQRRK